MLASFSARPSRLGLSLFCLIALFFALFSVRVQAAPQPIAIAVGGNNLTQLLWSNPDASLSLWKLAADGTVATQTPCGPFSGWSGQALAAGADSIPRILWYNTNGTLSLWHDTASAGGYSHAEFGPYTGYTAKSLAVGGDSVARLLWVKSDGSLSLWHDVSGASGFSYANFGPYSGYQPVLLGVGANTIPHVLWNRNDGAISLWNDVPGTGDFAHAEYGPYTGYAPLSLAVDSTGAPRVLWTGPSSTVSLWKVAANGAFAHTEYPDPSGYLPVGMACGTGGDVRLLWGDGQGDAQVWTISADGTYSAAFYSATASGSSALSSVTVSPASATLTTGSTQTFSAVAKNQNGVALSPQPTFTWTVAGVGTITSAGVYSAGSATGSATVTATSGMVSGTASVTINAVQTGGSASYNLSVNPINVDVTEASSGSVNAATVASVSPINSFADNVQLSISGLPSGISAAFSSPVVTISTGNASSNVTFTIASTTRPGFYPIDLRATSGNIVKSTPINLTISPPAQTANFAVIEDVDGLEIAPGSSDIVSLVLNPNSGFSGTVNLSLQDDPTAPIVNGTSNGIVATFSNSTLSSGSTASTLTVQVGTQVVEGTYHLLVKAASSTATQTLVLTIFVSPNDSGAGFGANVPASSPSSPPRPLASSVSDMVRYDLDDSNGTQLSSGQPVNTADDLGINFDGNGMPEAQDFNIQPHFLGANDDRIYIRTTYPSLPIQYPYSAVCKIVAYTGTGYVSVGTGTLIGNNHVLTAAHVLYDTSGHIANKIVVYPGYDNGASRVYHHASAKTIFIPNNFKTEIANDPSAASATYDDWALLDLKPIVGATRAARGKALGIAAQYMYATDDFVTPDVTSTIAGYPDVVKNAKRNSLYMYYSYVYNGDDGQVSDNTPDGLHQSTDLVFYSIDVSSGNSGGGIFRPDPAGIDNYIQHLFAVVRAGGVNFNDANLITTTRKNILQSLMHNDKDDIY